MSIKRSPFGIGDKILVEFRVPQQMLEAVPELGDEIRQPGDFGRKGSTCIPVDEAQRNIPFYMFLIAKYEKMPDGAIQKDSSLVCDYDVRTGKRKSWEDTVAKKICDIFYGSDLMFPKREWDMKTSTHWIYIRLWNPTSTYFGPGKHLSDEEFSDELNLLRAEVKFNDTVKYAPGVSLLVFQITSSARNEDALLQEIKDMVVSSKESCIGLLSSCEQSIYHPQGDDYEIGILGVQHSAALPGLWYESFDISIREQRQMLADALIEVRLL